MGAETWSAVTKSAGQMGYSALTEDLETNQQIDGFAVDQLQSMELVFYMKAQCKVGQPTRPRIQF